MKAVLIATHLLTVGIGFLAFRPSPDEATKSDFRPLVTSDRGRSPALPDDANPITHATAEDFRRTAELLLASGEDPWKFIILIEEWAKIDPEGAVLALTRVFSDQFSDDILRKLQHSTGSLLAPTLAEHYDKFEFINQHTVMSVTGRSIGELANEDVDAALNLLFSLPVPARELPLRDVVDPMSGESLFEFFTKFRNLPEARPIMEQEAFWRHSVRRAWRVLPSAEFASLFKHVDHPEGLKFLTWRSVLEATRFHEPEAFIRTYQSLPAPKKTIAFNAFETLLERDSRYNTSQFREALSRSQSPELVELLESADKN